MKHKCFSGTAVTLAMLMAWVRIPGLVKFPYYFSFGNCMQASH